MCAQGNKVTNPPCTIMDYTVNFIFYSYDKDKNALAKTLQNKVTENRPYWLTQLPDAMP